MLLLLLLLLQPHALTAAMHPLLQVDAAALTKAFAKQCFGRILAVNEVSWRAGVPWLTLGLTQ
jgi:hypothetical protein